jgi:hypothetical protein
MDQTKTEENRPMKTDKRPSLERPLTGVGAINFAMITSRNQKTNENNNCYLHYSTNP